MARGEIYAQVSCDYYDNAKMIRAGEKAEVLYVRALCLSNRLLLDGVILPEHFVSMRLERDGHKRAAALVDAGLWEVVDGGWRIVGWYERNRSRLEVMAVREAERDRKRAERQAAREARHRAKLADLSGNCPAGQTQVSARTQTPPSATVRDLSGPHRSSTNEHRSSTIDQRTSIIDQLPDEVDPVGTSQVLPLAGSAPRLRSADPQPLAGALGAVVGRLR